MTINAFVPCRAGSQRVPGKNTKPFGRFSGGLIELKLSQLMEAEAVTRIVVSSDDPEVRQTARRFADRRTKEVLIYDRPPELAIADSLDAFLRHVSDIMPDGTVAWTHVTSPFFDAQQWHEAVGTYRDQVLNGPYDSLMTVTPIRSFLWSDRGCISHDRNSVKWPQTQDLNPIYEVNSALFMIEKSEMAARLDRIGDRPYLFETDTIRGFDIDWPEDFASAELIASALLAAE